MPAVLPTAWAAPCQTKPSVQTKPADIAHHALMHLRLHGQPFRCSRSVFCQPFVKCCGTETVGTVTFCCSGTNCNLMTDLSWTGSVIKWNLKSSHRHIIKWCIWFPSFNIILFTFYKKFDENHQFFPRKKAYYVKRQYFFQICFSKLCFLWSSYGARTGTVTCQKSEPEP